MSHEHISISHHTLDMAFNALVESTEHLLGQNDYQNLDVFHKLGYSLAQKGLYQVFSEVSLALMGASYINDESCKNPAQVVRTLDGFFAQSIFKSRAFKGYAEAKGAQGAFVDFFARLEDLKVTSDEMKSAYESVLTQIESFFEGDDFKNLEVYAGKFKARWEIKSLYSDLKDFRKAVDGDCFPEASLLLNKIVECIHDKDFLERINQKRFGGSRKLTDSREYVDAISPVLNAISLAFLGIEQEAQKVVSQYQAFLGSVIDLNNHPKITESCAREINGLLVLLSKEIKDEGKHLSVLVKAEVAISKFKTEMKTYLEADQYEALEKQHFLVKEGIDSLILNIPNRPDSTEELLGKLENSTFPRLQNVIRSEIQKKDEKLFCEYQAVNRFNELAARIEGLLEAYSLKQESIQEMEKLEVWIRETDLDYFRKVCSLNPDVTPDRFINFAFLRFDRTGSLWGITSDDANKNLKETVEVLNRYITSDDDSEGSSLLKHLKKELLPSVLRVIEQEKGKKEGECARIQQALEKVRRELGQANKAVLAILEAPGYKAFNTETYAVRALKEVDHWIEGLIEGGVSLEDLKRELDLDHSNPLDTSIDFFQDEEDLEVCRLRWSMEGIIRNMRYAIQESARFDKWVERKKASAFEKDESLIELSYQDFPVRYSNEGNQEVGNRHRFSFSERDTGEAQERFQAVVNEFVENSAIPPANSVEPVISHF